jgi:antitoxin component YwqK of YwqJK toxin-antitoxin module
MDFMAQRALYPSRLIGLASFLALVGIIYMSAQYKVIPSKWVNENDKGLTRSRGVLYYNNVAFSGWIYNDYPNGNRYTETPYHNGKEEGIMKRWYADHKLEQERLFINGKKEGIHRGWWPDGKPKFEYYFENDEHNGTAKEWFSNSSPYRAFAYKAGHEEGRQQMWWDNGTIRANYVVKDGKQYGLIGRKLCKNTMKNEKS